ncbi:unnamed protein product [Cladocopium goreaui]|uniref:Galactose-1-phosphate uridyltransferase n=1 Tax=Cladocopium goreaui TaxID=2562237 RepID=A0A9P1CV94_9DINO|nr:unnamed protein product [Cladocopium goreaui]
MSGANRYRVRARSLTSMPEDAADSLTVLPVMFETETFGQEAAKKKKPWFCFPCWTEDDKAQLETSLDLTTWSLSDAERGKARQCLEQARQAGQAGEGHRPCMCFIRQDILTGKWAHFQLGTGNEKKPRQTESKSKQVAMRPIHEEPEQLDGCPFCACHVPEAADVLRFERLSCKLSTVGVLTWSNVV